MQETLKKLRIEKLDYRGYFDDELEKYVPIVQKMCDCTENQARKLLKGTFHKLGRFEWTISSNLIHLFSMDGIKIPFVIFESFLSFICKYGEIHIDDFYIHMIFEIIESDKYKEGLIPTSFANTLLDKYYNYRNDLRKKYFNPHERKDDSFLKKRLNLFFLLLKAPKIEISSDDYKLLVDVLYTKSLTKFIEIVSNIFKKNLNSFPDEIRRDLEDLNNRLYSFGMKKEDDISKTPYFERRDKESDWFIKKNYYYELYALFFSKEVIFDKFKLSFLRKGLEWLENNEETKISAFHRLVTSKSFMESKISNTLLEKSLYFDEVDKYFTEIYKKEYQSHNQRVEFHLDLESDFYYIEPIIWGLLTSKAYYEGKITEESLDILFDKEYRVIKIMIALLLFSKDYSKTEEQNNMDLIIDLLNYPKKEELCNKFESDIYLPIRIPNLYQNDDGIIIEEESMPYFWMGMPEPLSISYDPVRRLVYYIGNWLSTERVLPFTTRPLIRALQDK